MNQTFIAIPEDEEIKEILFSINADKALGPDGFSAGYIAPFGVLLTMMFIGISRTSLRTQISICAKNETKIRLISKEGLRLYTHFSLYHPL